jgi:hypothetical protein
MAEAPVYITHNELKRIFPQIDEYDAKTPIFGWSQETNCDDWGGESNHNIFFTPNTGKINNLYKDGMELSAVTPVEGTTLSGDVGSGGSALPVTSESNFALGDIIKVNDEYMKVAGTSSGVLTVTAGRNLFTTQSTNHASGSKVNIIFNESDLNLSDFNYFYYDDELDMVITVLENENPNDFHYEAGEDYKTLVSTISTDASRYLDSRLDPKLPKTQWKNSKGEFDYIIVRTTGLIASAFMIRTKNPTSEALESIEAEYEKNIDLLNSGRAALGFQNTGDASKGIIRDVSYTAGGLRPVDLKGTARSVDFDLIKIKVTTAGVLGTSKFDAFIKDSEKLKANKIREDIIITGDYQLLAYGIQVRFGGESDADTAALNDEWEVEVRGINEQTDTSDISGIKMTRRRGV